MCLELPQHRNNIAAGHQRLNSKAEKALVRELMPEEEAEVLRFLSEQISNTFGMVGFIRSNGLVSPHNRGTFYGFRNAGGQLEGVALIGHATLVDARSDEATRAFATIARDCSD